MIDIADVARRSGLTVSALRHYEEKGLIASAGRKGLRRQFDPDVLQRLALVSIGRDAGFTLDEIAGMFGPDGTPEIDRALLTRRADTLDRTIRRLTVLRDGLRHAAACPAPRHLECATFQRIVAAAMGPARPRRVRPVPPARPADA